MDVAGKLVADQPDLPGHGVQRPLAQRGSPDSTRPRVATTSSSGNKETKPE